MSLAYQMKPLKLVMESIFYPSRRWRFDFAFPEQKLAVEVEGGVYVNGRHNRGVGFENDLEKYSEAMKLGWNVYRCSHRLIKSGEALRVIEILLRANNASHSIKSKTG